MTANGNEPLPKAVNADEICAVLETDFQFFGPGIHEVIALRKAEIERHNLSSKEAAITVIALMLPHYHTRQPKLDDSMAGHVHEMLVAAIRFDQAGEVRPEVIGQLFMAVNQFYQGYGYRSQEDFVRRRSNKAD